MIPVLNFHIVVAAGSGSRYGGDLPKQFCLLNGRPLLMTTLERLCRGCGDQVILVLSPDMIETWKDMCIEYNFRLHPHIVEGGPTRAHSVRNAIAKIAGGRIGWISVHDGARPMVSSAIIYRLREAILEGHTGAIPVVPVTDSIRIVNADGSSRAVDRSLYRAVQTPQMFVGPKLIEAYSQELLPTFTDEATVMEAAGFTDIVLVEGDPANIKVTNPGDIARIEAMLQWTD